MAYTSEHLALAALELLNYWNGYPNMNGYLIFSAEIDDADIQQLPPEIDPHDYTVTREYGDAWVREKRSLALKVPTVALPIGSNLLINPGHPRFASFTYEALGEFSFDDRVRNLIDNAAR